MSSAALSVIIKYVINPNNIKPDKDKDTYPPEVYNKVQPYLLSIIFVFGALSILSILLIQPYEKDENNRVDTFIERIDIPKSDETLMIEKKLSGKEIDHSKSLKSMLFNRNTYFYAGIALCSYCKNI